MPYQFIIMVFLGGIFGVLFLLYLKDIFSENSDKICFFFLVFNVQEYFEGLVWDLRRISKWSGKEVTVFVVDMGSIDDTIQIIRHLDQKGFVRVLTSHQAARLIRNRRKEGNWVFNLNSNTEVKEIRKSMVKIFNGLKGNSESLPK